MINSIKEYIKKNILKNNNIDLKFIQLSSTLGKSFSKGRIVILVFKENEDLPFLICKFAKEKSNESSIVNEYEKTKKLNSMFFDLIPKPIDLVSIEERKVFIQECVNGKNISNILYENKNSMGYDEQKLNSMLISNINDIKSIIIRLNSKSITSDLDEFKIEIDKIKNEFITKYKLNSYELLNLSNSIDNFILIFKDKKICKRITNFDFTPFNIIKDGDKNWLIDFEYSQESTLNIIELLRYSYYLYKNLHELNIIKYTDNLIFGYYLFLSDFQNPIVKEFLHALKEIYGIEVNRKTRKLLCLILFILEANMQYDTKDYVSKDFVKYWKRIVNYFSEAYNEEEIFEYENSLVTEMNHFLCVKDVQLNECQEYIEKLEERLANKENLLKIKDEEKIKINSQLNNIKNEFEVSNKIICDLNKIIESKQEQINDIENSKGWKVIQRIKKLKAVLCRNK